MEAGTILLGTTSGAASALLMNGMAAKLAQGQPFVYIDGKGSFYSISKAKAKKRLKAAGLRPSEANAVVRQCVGQPFAQSHLLRKAMRHKKRHANAWFPWDVVIRR